MQGRLLFSPTPQIGNYGTNPDDNEATQPYIEGLIVREFSPVSSNWRSQQVAEEYLEHYKIPVLADIDTRALVRHLRDNGVMRGVISTLETDPTSWSPRRARFRRWTEPTWPKSSPPSSAMSGRWASARTSRRKWSA